MELKEKKICVVGLGYVGLPLARLFSTKYQTVGFDMNQRRVDTLMAGHDATLEVADDLLQDAVNNCGFVCTTDLDKIRDCNVYIVAVPTPVNDDNTPDLKPLWGASETVGKVINKGDIVIYESTVYPGVTEEECLPIVEKISSLKFNVDFYAGYSPERINPGDKYHTVEKIKKVTSGSTPEIAEIVDGLYNSVLVNGTHKAPSIKLADRICIIQDGKVAQCDTPENILKHPANQYVTEFIGANRLWANPEYIRAADIMRRRPFTISKGRTVIQALQIMRHNSVDSLLVLDKGQTLLGVVWLEELIGKREADPIEYYISDDYIAVEGETSLKEIIATIDYDVSGIIPVIQHDRKLLGYLTKSIILATMSKQFVPEHTAGERSGVICPATL